MYSFCAVGKPSSATEYHGPDTALLEAISKQCTWMSESLQLGALPRPSYYCFFIAMDLYQPLCNKWHNKYNTKMKKCMKRPIEEYVNVIFIQ